MEATMETTSIDEELAAALGEDFPYTFSYSSEICNTSSPDPVVDFDYTHLNPNPLPPPPPLIPAPPPQSPDQDQDQDQEKQSGRKKRKREPSRVMDHIMAERRRRELLTQRFIALSAIVPGLKKTDKTSVLGEAIQYLKALEEKVKLLEDVASKRTVESLVVVKKSALVVDHESVADNGSSCTADDDEHLPEIQVKVSDKSILLRLYCEKQKGLLPKLFAQIEKHDDLSVVSCNLIPFGDLASDITIVVQKKEEFNKIDVEDLLRSLRSAILFT